MRQPSMFMVSLLGLMIVAAIDGFSVGSPMNGQQHGISYSVIGSALSMAKVSKKKKKKSTGGSGGGGGGLKGFGGAPSSSDGYTIDTDRSKDARAFYNHLEQEKAGDNLVRCGLGFFSIAEDVQLRGVVALRDIKKGEPIINIPYELAVNLGQEGSDPTGPALAFLRDYCEVLSSGTASKNPRANYYRMLPPFRSEDCLGSTDFFSDEALEALQFPQIVEETLSRRKRTSFRFEAESDLPKWIDGGDLTEEHLRWAVWVITSRVLTVQGSENEDTSYRLLIPFLDMCNHDRASAHVLSGRATTGGQLKVIAGSNVKAGEQINICYGGGVAGNERFLQDYGFLDSSDKGKAFAMVAQQLLGRRRIVEGANAGRLMAEPDRAETLELLQSTTLEEDQAMFQSASTQDVKAAISFRIGVKNALAELQP